MANARKRSAGNELVFMALGGIGEIGMNCYLYGLGPPDARKWLMIDLGITFPEGENDPGIDVILPDLRFIEEERANLVGPRAHPRARGPPRRGDRAVAAAEGADLCNSVHGGDAEIQACRLRRQAAAADQGGAAQRPLRRRPVRSGAGRGRAFDPGAQRRRHPHALRHRAAHGRLEDRCHAHGRAAHGRGEAQAARRRGRAGDDLRFHQRPARGPLALRDGRGQVARRHHPRRQAARRRHDLRLQRRAHQGGGGGRQGAAAGRWWWRAGPCTASSAWPWRRAICPAISSTTTSSTSPTWRRDEVVLLCTGSQGEPRAAVARIAEDQHPARAAGRGRPDHLLLAHHPGQRAHGRAHPEPARSIWAARSSPTATRWCTSPAIRAARS